MRFALLCSTHFTLIFLSSAVSGVHYKKPDPEMSMVDLNIPETQFGNKTDIPYILAADRLDEIRSNFMYPFYDSGGPNNSGDYQKDIHDYSPEVRKGLDFNLPFFGRSFNFIRVSLDGYLGFNNGQISTSPAYPLKFPKQPDPTFIGQFYSNCNIGDLAGDEVDKRRTGVYFRVESNLMYKTDQRGVELREWLQNDIREGIIGAEPFKPRHAIIATWKNVTFAGRSFRKTKKTNTFQTVVVTDETRTYVIFNYQHIGWTTHTEAGGSPEHGTGGIPAFIGFNAGNGSGAYEYKPYSQSHNFLSILSTGNINGKPGRHIFRVDKKIMPGQCIPEMDNIPHSVEQLTFAPESGKREGGTTVFLTGPCFNITNNFTCEFTPYEVPGVVIDQNRAKCVMPPINWGGYTNLYVHVDRSNKMVWYGKFLVESLLSQDIKRYKNSSTIQTLSVNLYSALVFIIIHFKLI